MAEINMDLILPEFDNYIKTPEVKKEINNALKKVTISLRSMSDGTSGRHSVDEIASEFIKVMFDSARSTQGAGARGGVLGETAIAAISNFTAGEPITSEENGDTVVTIPFNFVGDLHRDSLYSSRYGGVDNIVALLNNGYSAKDTVFGQWHGKPIVSLQERSGSGFIQNAVRQFWDRYSSEYNLVNIEISDEYK